MPTTTIRLDEKLKARVAAAAERAGKTSHAFILEAIAQTVEQTELRDQFHRDTDERWAKILATGKTIGWEDVRTYLGARTAGRRARRPQSRQLVRRGGRGAD